MVTILRKREHVMRLTAIFFGVLITLSLSAQFGGGNGTENNPYQINRVQHLEELRDYLGEDHTDVYFIQTADLDLDIPPHNEGQGWVPIGSYSDGQHFYGTYDGNGFTISGMMIDHIASYRGFFSSLQDATLKNIRLVDADVTSSARSGIMVARAHDSMIINCHVSGNYFYDAGLAQNHGGLVAECYDTTIMNSGVDINMRCRGRILGGLVGHLENSIIKNCYAHGVIASYDPGFIAPQQWGSLIGNATTTLIPAGETEISNSYSMVDIDMSAGNHSSIGGFIGSINARTTVTNCYMGGRMIDVDRGGGFINSGNGTVINSYWNTETTNFDESPGGGEPRNTEEMVHPYRGDRDVYVNWDFDEIWVHDENEFNEGYPYLFYQVPPPPDIDAPVVSIEKFTEDEQEFVRVEWEPVEDALSYKVYLSDYAYREDWGEAITITEDTFYITEAEETGTKFFFVTASPEPAP